jgi:hypothetical protein
VFTATDDQPGLAKALKVGPHAVRMQRETLGEFFGACRPLEFAEQPEEPGSARLCERVAVRGRVHAAEFRTGGLGKSVRA